MKVITGGETDLEVHYIAYAMRLCGLDYGDYDERLTKFDEQYGVKLDDIFLDIDDIVLPMLEATKKLNEPDEWFGDWLPIATPYVGCETNVNDPTDNTFSCRIDTRREIRFDNIKEVKVVDRIAYLVNKYADSKVAVDFVIDALNAVLADKKFINSIDDRIKSIVNTSRPSSISPMSIVGRD